LTGKRQTGWSRAAVNATDGPNGCHGLVNRVVDSVNARTDSAVP
jgi:hypothetical protein